MPKIMGSLMSGMLGSVGSLTSGVLSSALSLILPLMLILGLGTTLGKKFDIPIDSIKGFIKEVLMNGFTAVKDIGSDLWNSFGFSSDKNKGKNHEKTITKAHDGTLKA